MPTAYAVTASADQVASDTAIELTKLFELILTRIPLFIAGGIVIIISFFLAKIGRSVIENKLAEHGIEEEHQELQILGGRIAYTAILTLGITVGLKIGGIDLTTILAAVAFGIGFALKDLIMNFLAGIMILVGRHFTIGDFISVGGTLGKVVEIQSRVTILQAIDGTKVIVPNSEMFKKQVTSFTSNPFRRIELVVGVDYRQNLENVLKVCMSVLKSTKGVLLEPKPAVLISEFAESSINIKMKAWVSSTGGWIKIKSNLAKNLKKKFDEYGIVIPWPIRTISYDKDSQISEKMFEEPKEESKPVIENSPKTPVITSQTVVPALQEAEEEQPLRPLSERK